MENLNLLSRKKFTMDKFLNQMKVSAENEIVKVLNVSASPIITSKECSNSIVSVGGKVIINVIYQTSDGTIDCAQGSFDFIEKQPSSFTLDDLVVEDDVKVTSVDALNFEVILTIEHAVTVFGTYNYEINRNFDENASLVLDKKSFSCLNLIKSTEDTFVVAEEAESNLSGIKVLCSKAKAICTEVSSNVDKVVLEGKVLVETIYLSDGSLGAVQREIEFKQEMLASGVLPNMLARADINAVSVNVSAEEKNNKSNLIYAIDVYAKAFVYEEISTEIITDMFSLSNEVQTKIAYIEAKNFAERKVCSENMVISTNIFEIENIDDIIGVFEPYYEVEKVETFDDSVKISGTVSAFALYKSAEKIERFEITEQASFEISKDSSESLDKISSAIEVNSFKVRSGGRELETELKINYEVEFTKSVSEKYVASYEVLNEKPENVNGVKVYITSGGDTLFEVAKAVNVKPEIIAEQNQVDGIFEGGEKIYIYSPINLI